MESPAVSKDNFWQLYLGVLERFTAFRNEHPDDALHFNSAIRERQQVESCLQSEPIHVLPGLKELRQRDRVIGEHIDGIHMLAVSGYPQSTGERQGGDDIDESALFPVFSSDEEELDDDDPGML